MAQAVNLISRPGRCLGSREALVIAWCVNCGACLLWMPTAVTSYLILQSIIYMIIQGHVAFKEVI
jgi:hypothetical protein